MINIIIWASINRIKIHFKVLLYKDLNKMILKLIVNIFWYYFVLDKIFNDFLSRKRNKIKFQ